MANRSTTRGCPALLRPVALHEEGPCRPVLAIRNSMRYSGPGMRRSAVVDLFWRAALWVAAICLTVDVGFPETHCTVVRMDPAEVTIPAEGGLMEATLTISPDPFPEDPWTRSWPP